MSSHPPPDDSRSRDQQREQQLELGEDELSIALRRAWDKTLRAMATKYNKQTFENWLRPLRPLSYDGEIVVLGALSAFAREWAEKKYHTLLRALLEQHLDRPGLQLRFVKMTAEVQPLLGEKPLPLQQAASPLGDLTRQPEPPSPAGGGPALPVPSTPAASSGFPEKPGHANPFSLALASAPLNDKYTFDHFVVGKSNRLAHAGAVAVAQSPGTVYNPLFLYGSPGLGKTHLMHAIGHQIRLGLPQARIAYVSGETFTNHYVAAIREKRTEDFRQAYRNVDVWLVDDIQTIASGYKEQTKEEFFHTFNTLYQMKRQIVIASDRSPRELRTMDERLRSRFECGLIADIAPPEYEMRMAILQKKAILENLRIPDEVIAFMANLIQSNIRALEGALIKLMAYASLAKSPVTKQLARDVLSGYFVERLPRATPAASAHPEDYDGQAEDEPGQDRALPAPAATAGATVDQIIESVAAHFSLDKEQILAGRGRGKDVAFARQIAMYLCREMSSTPMSTLASVFGCKNHTAIAHAHARMAEALKTDPQTLATIARIRKVIEYSL